MDAQRFAGRVALVTGGSGGIGRAVVAAFLAEGALVAALARRADELAQFRINVGAGEALLTIAADLLQPGAAEQAVREVLAWRDRVDILVNATGAFSGGKAVGESLPEEWQRMLDVNLLAALQAMRAVLPGMAAHGYGRIVNISSRSARAIGRNVAAYTAAKAGLEALTVASAEEYRDRNVTVNAVAPSVVATPAMLAGASAKARERWVTPESVARVILFLASDEAADVSGAVLPVYGRA